MQKQKYLTLAVSFVLFTAIAGLTSWSVCHHSPQAIELSSIDESQMTPEELEVARDIVKVEGLVEETLTWRAKALAFTDKLKEREAKGEPYTAEQVQTIHEGAKSYLVQRKKLLELAHKYAWLADEDRKLLLAPNQSTSGATPNGDAKIRINPIDRDGQLAMRKLMISLSTALVLYDNYLIAIYPFQDKGKVRRLVNTDVNDETANGLAEVTASFVDRGQIYAVQRAILFFEKTADWLKERNALSKDPHTQYLEVLIRGSVNYDRLRDYHWYNNSWQRITSWRYRGRDSILTFGSEAMNFVSMVFGNSMGMVQSRSGKLKSLPTAHPDQFNAIKARLKPLDILFEKTPFRLTDKFIPGHFGHVAIWVGTDEELQELGVWDDPKLTDEKVREKYKLVREQVKAGHHIVEALRPGVEINTLEHFLDIDDFSAIRHRSLTNQQKHDMLVLALLQIGKEYDFNFDVETDKKIVCSELAYVVYNNLDWPTKKSLGRFAISPDNVAVRATNGGEFDVVELWHDGQHVPDNIQPQAFAKLLKDSELDFKQMEVLVASDTQ